MLLEYQGSTRLSILSPIEGFYWPSAHTLKVTEINQNKIYVMEALYQPFGKVRLEYGDV